MPDGAQQCPVTVDPLRTGIALAILFIAAMAVMTLGGIAFRREAAIASARALAQLTLVALVIAWIFTHPEGAIVYLTLMLVAAAVTSTRRIGGDLRDGLGVLAALAAGAGATVLVVTLTGALEFTPQALLPFAAQMIGGAMTAASLAGVRLRDDVRDQMPVFQGYVSLGATYRQAGRPFARRAAERSLFPTVDQTKSAGLVTLPGAFVGMLLGGATPLAAAQVQLLVLIGLLLVQALAALLTTRLISPLPSGVGRNIAEPTAVSA